MKTLNEAELSIVSGGDTFGAIVGGVIGAVITKTPQGALAGAKIGSAVEDWVNGLDD